MKQKILILHGWGGSDSPHWQSWLAGEIAKSYGTVSFPLLDNPHFPSKNRQMKQVRNLLDTFQPDTVICHSLANVIWFHLCQEEEINSVDRLLLVAPPSSQCDIEIIRKFFPYTPPHNLYAKEVLLVTSTTDPYLTMQEAKTLQENLGVEMHILKDAGHINEESGYGAWEWAWEWVKAGEKRDG
jgi:predicted alpha/beta hydrolase family esterase